MNETTIHIVKATAPVLAQHGTAITTRMYDIMFREYPSIKKLFNASHQQKKNGEMVSAQAATLANAIYGFAAHVDELDKLKDVIPLMVNKHVSLNILPEHYPIVGTCVLRAIQDTLGEAATESIINAWKEAYFFLADILIGLENEVKNKFEHSKGGWKAGFHKLMVDKKEQESQDIVSIYFKKNPEIEGGNTPEQLQLPSFVPGQFLSVRFVLPAETLVRNYTISNAPNQEHLRISVKLEGKVSTLLHYVDIGTNIEIGIPAGNFNILDDMIGPIILIHAGSGITPFISMIESMYNGSIPKRKVYFIQYHKNILYHPFKKRTEEIAIENPDYFIPYVYYSEELKTEEDILEANANPLKITKIGKGHFHTNHLDILLNEDNNIKENGHFFLCGGNQFLKDVNNGLIDHFKIPLNRIHYEYFGPTQKI